MPYQLRDIDLKCDWKPCPSVPTKQVVSDENVCVGRFCEFHAELRMRDLQLAESFVDEQVKGLLEQRYDLEEE